MTFSFSIALVWLDLAGVFFFAVSGSLLAARKQFDIIGSLLLASLVEPGRRRDPRHHHQRRARPRPSPTRPTWRPPLLATVLVYFLFSSVQRFTSLLILFDAGGLALFCITGTLKALAAGMNPVAAVLLGVTTAVGGGLLRDITANEVPAALRPQGSLRAAGLRGGGADRGPVRSRGPSTRLTACAVAAVVFAFRVTAWRRHWHVPLAVRGWHRLGLDAGGNPEAQGLARIRP